MVTYGFVEPLTLFPIYIGVSELGVACISYAEPPPAGARCDGTHPLVSLAARQLGEYFGGIRREFDLPLDLRGTDFQVSVWKALLKIPYGETRSYGQIALELGKAAAVRAVGAANGANPIAIVVPCHRVIGARGALTGYGGGLDRKRFLLELESRVSMSRSSS